MPFAKGNQSKLKHGHSTATQRSPEYYSWRSMKDRCLNPKATNFKNWGGRGIRIHPEWMCFENFLRDMGERPPGTSLDRIDNKGNYEPGNCRWATRTEQGRNSRHATLIKRDGKTLCITEWCEILNFPRHLVYDRIWRNVPEKDLFNPPQKAIHGN